MADSPRIERQSWAPWIIAIVAGVVFVVGLIVYYVPLDHARSDRSAGTFSSREKAAMTAAAVETVNILTYSRANFDADYARALSGVTGSLKTDLEGTKAKTKAAITSGKFDLTARVVHQALVGPNGKGYDVLLSINGYKSTAPDVPTQQNLRVTVVMVGSKWLASDSQLVAVS